MTDSDVNIVPKGKSILLMCCSILLVCIALVVWGIVESGKQELARQSKNALESIDSMQTTVYTMKRINAYVDEINSATEKVIELNDQIVAENKRLREENEALTTTNAQLKERVNTLIVEKNNLIIERNSFIDMIDEINSAVL